MTFSDVFGPVRMRSDTFGCVRMHFSSGKRFSVFKVMHKFGGGWSRDTFGPGKRFFSLGDSSASFSPHFLALCVQLLALR